MRSKILISLLLVLFAKIQTLHAQLILSGGAEIHVNNGTQITFTSHSDSLQLNDSSKIKNDGVLLFLNQSKVNEQNNFPIYGNGWEESRSSLIPLNNFNSSNLGLNISSDSLSSLLTIKRFHSDTLLQMNGSSSVKRYFKIESSNSIYPINISFEFDSTELNNLSVDYLKIIGFNSSSINNLGGQLINGDRIGIVQSDSLNYFVLSEVISLISNSDDSIYCAGDQYNFELTHQGIFNSGNLNYLYLSNGIDTILLDSSLTNYFSSILPDTLSSANYYLFSYSENGFNYSFNTLTLTINGLPVIDTSLIVQSYCFNSPSDLILISPFGGVFSGIGINGNEFNPQLSGTGEFVINYLYSDSFTCSSETNFTIHVSTPFAQLDTLFSVCENENNILLNQGIPSGGTYFGPGVSGTNFDPTFTGSGLFEIFYTVNDANNCTDTASNFIEVLARPGIPVITANLDELSTGIYDQYQWYLNGGILSGETNQNIIVTQNGDYFVIVQNGFGCEDTSLVYSFNSVGVESNTSGIEITIYPNPTYGILNVNNLSGSESEIFIFNINGQKTLSAIINNQKGTIDVSELSEGIYFIEINSLSQNYKLKFVKL